MTSLQSKDSRELRLFRWKTVVKLSDILTNINVLLNKTVPYKYSLSHTEKEGSFSKI